jgi:hypothetical protein
MQFSAVPRLRCAFDLRLFPVWQQSRDWLTPRYVVAPGPLLPATQFVILHLELMYQVARSAFFKFRFDLSMFLLLKEARKCTSSVGQSSRYDINRFLVLMQLRTWTSVCFLC